MACGKRELDGLCLLNPTLLFEVLSPSTRDYDAGAKREHYQEIPSLRHLLLFDQPDRIIRHHYRASGGDWLLSEIREGSVELPDVGGSVALDDLHRLPE